MPPDMYRQEAIVPADFLSHDIITQTRHALLIHDLLISTGKYTESLWAICYSYILFVSRPTKSRIIKTKLLLFVFRLAVFFLKQLGVLVAPFNHGVDNRN